MKYPAFIRKLYNPPEFQGNFRKRKYFEGWYLKHVTADLSQSISFIPGISLSGDPHCFIQVLDGITGVSNYIRYDLDKFRAEPGKFSVWIGDSHFSDHYSELYISGDDVEVSGRIDYGNTIPYNGNLLNPGIMGWYSFVPFMECKHGVVSLNHQLTGGIEMNGRKIDFSGGKGYIEKDWGTSFPESWIWVQCNHFGDHDTSFMLSVAKIPWLSNYFIGFLGFLYAGQRLYRFSTYNRSKVIQLDSSENILNITLDNKSFSVEAVITSSQFGDLKAPKSGMMERYIKESIDSSLEIQLTDKSTKDSSKFHGERSGLEIVGNLDTLREIISQ